MQKVIVVSLLILSLSFSACTNMSRTQQGALSGGAIGAGTGLGIAALTGGGLLFGSLLGGGLGAVAGGLYGNQQEGQDTRHHERR